MLNVTARAMGRAQGLTSRIKISPDNRRIIVAAGLVGVLTVLVKIAATLREVMVAAKLGTGDAAEAYIVAWVIPGFVSLLISDGIVSCLVPLYTSARTRRGEVAGEQVYAEILLIGIVLLELATLVLALTPRVLLPIFASEFSPQKMALAERLWLLMLPAMFIGGLASIWSGMLNAGNRFGLAAVSPIAGPAFSGLGLWLFPHHAVEALAVGFVLGCVVQLLVIGWEMRKHQLRLTPAWYGGMPETRALHLQFLPLLANNIVFNGLPLVDTAMAATLGKHQVAILTYGNRIVLPILSITSIALGTVVFPYFSQLAARQDWRGLQRTLSHYLYLILLATVPLAIGIIVLSEEVVRLLFERGEFTAGDTAAVARVQAVFALMIPAYTIASVVSRVVISLQKSQLMLLVSVGVFAFNLIGNYVLKQIMGIEGIALATVGNQVIQATVLIIICRRVLRDLIVESEPDRPS